MSIDFSVKAAQTDRMIRVSIQLASRVDKRCQVPELNGREMMKLMSDQLVLDGRSVSLFLAPLFLSVPEIPRRRPGSRRSWTSCECIAVPQSRHPEEQCARSSRGAWTTQTPHHIKSRLGCWPMPTTISRRFRRRRRRSGPSWVHGIHDLKQPDTIRLPQPLGGLTGRSRHPGLYGDLRESVVKTDLPPVTVFSMQWSASTSGCE